MIVKFTAWVYDIGTYIFQKLYPGRMKNIVQYSFFDSITLLHSIVTCLGARKKTYFLQIGTDHHWYNIIIVRNAFVFRGLAAGIETPVECKSCHLLNISQCEVSENSEQFVLTLYNPLSRPVTEFVRLPIPGETAYSVVDPSGQKLTVQFVPLPSAVLRIPGRQSLATAELVFQADDLPPLGYKSYLITKASRSSYLNSLRAKRSEQLKIENLVDIGNTVSIAIFILLLFKRMQNIIW